MRTNRSLVVLGELGLKQISGAAAQSPV